MYRPETYARLMEYATRLRAIADRPMWGLVPPRGPKSLAWRVGVIQQAILRRLFSRFDNLVEHAYLVGHEEGYIDGKVEGITEGEDEANCHPLSDDEWEHARTGKCS